MITSQKLNFAEKPIIDESIEEYEYHEYKPLAGTDPNVTGDIVINIQLQNLFSHPSESYLVFEGRLTITTAPLTQMLTLLHYVTTE